MKYIKTKEKIVLDSQDFNAKDILECGQCFRFTKTNNGYFVYSLDKCAKVLEADNKVEIISNDIDYFEKYFDLKTNYESVKTEIIKRYKNKFNSDYTFLEKALEYGNGIRILNQDSFEMVVSFVISQNNNIKRIQLIIDRLCKKFGKNMGEYFAFPTIEALKNISLEQYKELGFGYRANYMPDVVSFLSSFNKNEFEKLCFNDQLKTLLKVKGIGPKVADCIMLFGFHNMNTFPVDTWIEKVYKNYFNNSETDRKVMHKKLIETFNEYSGYAQQYLFYYERNKK